MKLLYLLLSKGYLPYRRLYTPTTKSFTNTYVTSNLEEFSSIVPAKLDLILSKTPLQEGLPLPKDCFIFGLFERGYPPSLIYPRFKCKTEDNSKFIETHSAEELFEFIQNNKNIYS